MEKEPRPEIERNRAFFATHSFLKNTTKVYVRALRTRFFSIFPVKDISNAFFRALRAKIHPRIPSADFEGKTKEHRMLAPRMSGNFALHPWVRFSLPCSGCASGPLHVGPPNDRKKTKKTKCLFTTLDQPPGATAGGGAEANARCALLLSGHPASRTRQPSAGSAPTMETGERARNGPPLGSAAGATTPALGGRCRALLPRPHGD